MDRHQWELEYQQVAPQLQIQIAAADARDWRGQCEAAVSHQERAFASSSSAAAASHDAAGRKAAAGGGWPATRATLQQVRADVTEQLSKIDTRERFLNNEFTTRTSEYRNKRENFDRTQARGRRSCPRHPASSPKRAGNAATALPVPAAN